MELTAPQGTSFLFLSLHAPSTLLLLDGVLEDTLSLDEMWILHHKR